MVMDLSLVELATAAVAILAAMAEVLHARRCRRLAAWLSVRPETRFLGAAGTGAARRGHHCSLLGLATLLVLPPKAHVADTVPTTSAGMF